MFWVIFLTGICAPGWTAGTVTCNEDSQCPVDFYCNLDAYSCIQCFPCDEFKRNGSPAGTACIKSALGCGASLDQKRKENRELPTYAWILLALSIALVSGCVTITLIHWFHKTYTYVIPRSYIQIPVPETNDQLESAWSSPPSYDAVVNIPSAVEESALYVKPDATAPTIEACEAAGRQTTRPYNPPNYIRRPQQAPVLLPDNSDSGMENTVDGAVRRREDSVTDGTAWNISVEEPSTITSNSRLSPGEITDCPDNAGGMPVVVINNNVTLQSVSVAAASIVLPPPSNSMEPATAAFVAQR